jgi:hypothetical protein
VSGGARVRVGDRGPGAGHGPVPDCPTGSPVGGALGAYSALRMTARTDRAMAAATSTANTSITSRAAT